MIKNNPKKGDILVYTDSMNQKYVQVNDLIVYIGTIVVDVDTKEKKVVTGTPKKLGVLLTEQENRIDSVEKELNNLTRTYRRNTKKLLSIIEILVNQTELNNMNINDLKAIKEEIENDDKKN